MTAKSSKKINYLAYLNLAMGFISFLTGLVPLILFVSTIISFSTKSYTWDVYVFEPLGDVFFDLIRDPNFLIGTCICIFLSLCTQWLGLIASISINDKFHRGIAFSGNLFGTFGLIGNLLTLLVFYLSWLAI